MILKMFVKSCKSSKYLFIFLQAERKQVLTQTVFRECVFLKFNLKEQIYVVLLLHPACSTDEEQSESTRSRGSGLASFVYEEINGINWS